MWFLLVVLCLRYFLFAVLGCLSLFIVLDIADLWLVFGLCFDGFAIVI